MCSKHLPLMNLSTEVVMKVFPWLMSCSVLFLLSGCFYPGPPPQHSSASQPTQPQPAQPAPSSQPSLQPPGVCGTRAGWSCPAGQYCDYGLDKCNMPDAEGTCRPRPEMCTQQYEPVCGCDGRTYGNSCMATLAGASIRHPGRCQAAAPPVRDHRRRY